MRGAKLQEHEIDAQDLWDLDSKVEMARKKPALPARGFFR